MSKSMLYTILERRAKDLEVIWVDDVWLRNSDEGGNRFTGRPKTWIDYTLNLIPLKDDPDLPLMMHILDGLYHICKTRGIGLSLTNFAGFENNANYLVDKINRGENLLLLDVHNEFAKRNENTYGIKLAIKLELDMSYVRFVTRQTHIVAQEAMRYKGEISAEMSIAPSVDKFEEGNKTSTWIDSFLIHKDPVISSVLRLFSKPWVEGSKEWGRHAYWAHDCLEKDSKHIRELANWLDVESESLLENDGESAKSLILVPDPESSQGPIYPWSKGAPHRSTRKMKGTVLNALLEKLKLPLKHEVDEGRWYAVPSVPALPFFVALRMFWWHTSKDPSYDAFQLFSVTKHQSAHNSLSHDAYVLSLALSEDNGDEWGLAKAVTHSAAHEGEGTTRKMLINTLYCKTSGLKTDAMQYVDLFATGAPFPVVGLLFEPNFIHLTWTQL